MKKLLLVDDESHIVSGLRMLIKRYFSDRYAVVADAASGKEAIEKTKELSPDIILMDVQMPGISGLDVIRALSQSGKSKAFVLITAYERFEIAREALQLGVCDYLLKPVSRDRLEVALNSASLYLERSRILEERELSILEREKRLVPYLRQAFFHALKSETSSEQDIELLLTFLHEHRKE
ncbi:MAG: response regulator, partial [Spirochaetes bacterium]|nr:response regulator [Spirochaetota bacterium]